MEPTDAEAMECMLNGQRELEGLSEWVDNSCGGSFKLPELANQVIALLCTKIAGANFIFGLFLNDTKTLATSSYWYGYKSGMEAAIRQKID